MSDDLSPPDTHTIAGWSLPVGSYIQGGTKDKMREKEMTAEKASFQPHPRQKKIFDDSDKGIRFTCAEWPREPLAPRTPAILNQAAATGTKDE